MAYLKLFTLGLAPGLNGPDIQSLQKGARGARSECRMRCWHWFKAQHQTIKPGLANLNLESLLLRMLAAPIFQRQNCGLCGLLDTGSSAAAQEANTMDKRFACFFFTRLASRFSPRMGPLARSSVQCTVRILQDVTRLSEFESHQSLADCKFGSSILWIPCDVSTEDRFGVARAPFHTHSDDLNRKRRPTIPLGYHPAATQRDHRPPCPQLPRSRYSFLGFSRLILIPNQGQTLVTYLPPARPPSDCLPFPPGVTKTLSLEGAHSGRMIPSNPCQVDGEPLNPPPAELSVTVPRDGHSVLESAALIEIFPGPTSSVGGLSMPILLFAQAGCFFQSGLIWPSLSDWLVNYGWILSTFLDASLWFPNVALGILEMLDSSTPVLRRSSSRLHWNAMMHPYVCRPCRLPRGISPSAGDLEIGLAYAVADPIPDLVRLAPDVVIVASRLGLVICFGAWPLCFIKYVWAKAASSHKKSAYILAAVTHRQGHWSTLSVARLVTRRCGHHERSRTARSAPPPARLTAVPFVVRFAPGPTLELELNGTNPPRRCGWPLILPTYLTTTEQPTGSCLRNTH
ncbi:uncharacterized protein CLUP02_09471 [Colletotrichum lupini]|uniref:Uncharacterized protein n=1 Tax=Colletotrichum lupini TaxID=145971 RepID=A0A9Q8WIM1_9PEZI|nr:uncharacterized protein CLUP02_09471 [Colletotrichum lupini]UQC83975.1 hypothetical protein CLUP02_09471 [Colletotrichum lupini]